MLWIPTTMSVLAFFLGLGTLILNIQNRKDRIRTEATALKSEILGIFFACKSGVNVTVSNQEIARIEMRRLQDSSSKYEAIEQMPANIKTAKSLIEKLEYAYSKLEPLTVEASAETVTFLQDVALEARKLPLMIQELEAASIRMLQTVRESIESAPRLIHNFPVVADSENGPPRSSSEEADTTEKGNCG